MERTVQLFHTVCPLPTSHTISISTESFWLMEPFRSGRAVFLVANGQVCFVVAKLVILSIKS